MRAAVVKSRDGIEIETVDVPACGPEDVLIRVEACALCSSDLRVIQYPGPGQPPYGQFIPGHEYSGVVVERGSRVDEFEVGDRVAAEAHFGCGRCTNCRRGMYTSCLNWGNSLRGHRASGKTTQGGFAEYVNNHVSTVYRIPDSVSFDEASLITNLGCVLYGFEKFGAYVVGEQAVVIGDGPIGLLSAHVAHLLGADKVTLFGLDKEKLRLAVEEYGADEAYDFYVKDPREVLKKGDPQDGVDLAIEASGTDEGIAAALSLPKWGGRVLLIGIPKTGETAADFKDIIRGNKDIYTVRGEGLSNCGRAVSLLKRGRISMKSLITHRFGLDDINEAIQIHSDKAVISLKVVVHP